MSEFKIGDAVRLKSDERQTSAVKHGETYYVIEVNAKFGGDWISLADTPGGEWIEGWGAKRFELVQDAPVEVDVNLSAAEQFQIDNTFAFFNALRVWLEANDYKVVKR